MKQITIHDNVHGIIILPSYVEKVIQTKEFQRLRNLKQLGVTNFVFPGAIHTRYEHCIGTAHLCNVLLNILERNSNQKIDEIHKICVILAGLLHDLGHGPFSHFWETFVHLEDSYWTHEMSSCEMVRQLFVRNNIKLHSNPDVHSYCVELITALIKGNINELSNLLSPELMFLTEIVSNKYCNIDVDKIDYILRDAYHLKHSVTLKQFEGFLDRAQIIGAHIGYHVDDFHLIENLFINRCNLHKTIYQHPQVGAVENLHFDILKSAEKNGFLFKNKKLSMAHKYPEVFLDLDDTIIKIIQISDNPQLTEAKSLIDRLKRNQFYNEICIEPKDFDVSNIRVLNTQLGNNFMSHRIAVPNPEVPRNIVLYDDKGPLDVYPPIDYSLSYEAILIISKSLDSSVNEQAKNMIRNNNNNNNKE